MKATKRNRARSPKFQQRKLNKRRWKPQSEVLEARQLLAADLIFETTPYDHDAKPETAPQPFTLSFDSLDFIDGNALISNYSAVLQGGEGEFLYQASLVGFNADAGPVTPNGGLNSDYEVTAIMRAKVSLNADGEIALTMPQNSSTFGLEIYYNDIGGIYGGSALDKANALAGTGYDDGTLILKAEVTGLREVSLVATPPLVPFDAFGNNDYPGFQTVFVFGGFAISAAPTYVDPAHLDVRYGGPLAATDLQQMLFNFNVQDPFTGTNPSRKFFAEDGGVAAGTKPEYTPNLGTFNGQGPDLQVEADAQIPMRLREASIHGFKYEDMIKNGKYDPPGDPTLGIADKPLAGVRFELWTDLDHDGVIEAGDTLVPGMVSVTNANGEFWFEPVDPGYYVVKEIPNTPSSEVQPSTHTTFPVFLCAGEEWVWEEGAADFGQVVERGIFYNNSAWDNYNTPNTSITENNAAIPPQSDKTAYLPGSGTATTKNYTSYDKGINGIYVDIVNGGVHHAITAADFEFKVGNDNNPSLWATGPVPIAVTQVIGGGVGGSTRVYIEFADGAIRNEWLRVKVLANGRTRILQDDIHFWGNQVGETLNIPGPPPNTEVDGTDSALVFANYAEGVGITNALDVNRDRRVDGIDSSVIYGNYAFGIYVLNNPTALPVNVWHYADDEIVKDPGLLFGNYVVGSIHGFKFDDYEADGKYDPNGWDLPFGGVEFELTGFMYNPATGQFDMPVPARRGISDHGGEFWFEGLAPGVYTVTELQPSWSSVMPSTPTVSRQVFVTSGQEHVWKSGAAMLPTEGTLREEVLVSPNEFGIDEGLIFGNYVKGSVHGFKFEDDNGNGKYDGTDTPWAGIKFNLYYQNEDGSKGDLAMGPAATNANGEFWFTGVVPGYYIVEEILSPELNVEYKPTRPVSRPVFVGSREELVWKAGAAMLPNGALQHEILDRAQPHPFNGREELVFGNYIPGSIHGFKAEDLDGNGTATIFNDKGEFVGYEPGLAGVTIFLSGRSGEYTGEGNNVNLSTTTDANGHFWFEDLRPGTYEVYEKVNPVGYNTSGDNPSLVGLPDQGQLLDASGNVAFPIDNVMETQSNTVQFTITSRDEYVWTPGAGHFQQYCFTDNPGLVQVSGETAALTHILCEGEMATHTVRVDVPMPSDAYHVQELEIKGLNGGDQATKDGGPAKWTAGTYTFAAPDVPGFPHYFNYTSPGALPLTGTGLKFEVKIESGKVRIATQTSVNTNSLTPNFAPANPLSAVYVSGSNAGTGFKVNVTVDGNGTPTWTIADQGKNYVEGDVVKIPFSLIGGQTPTDDIILKITQVESKFVDLRPTGNPGDDIDTVGPDAGVLMGGKAYEVGDMFTITPQGSVVGDVLAINTTPISQGTGYGAPGQATPTYTYTNVPVVEPGGLTMDVTIDTNPASPTYQKVLSVALKNHGTGYFTNQVVTIDGLQLDAGSNDDVKVQITSVGDDRVMLQVIEVGNTTLDVLLMEMGDEWNQSDVTTANPVVINSLLGGNPTQSVSWTLKLTGKGYDDRIDYNVKVDGVPFTGKIFVDTVDLGSDFYVGVNNGTLRQEIVRNGNTNIPTNTGQGIDEQLIFENYVKGSIHGYKFHDTNLNGVEDNGDTPFNGIEYSPADANGLLLIPDYTFSGSLNPPAPNGALPYYGQYQLVNGKGVGVGAPGLGWSYEAAAGHTAPGSAKATITEDQTASMTILAFTPFSAGIGFSKLIDSNGGEAADPGDVLRFYIDDVLQGTWTGDDATFNDVWFDGVEWGWHKYTWTFSNDAEEPNNAPSTAWIDDIRFTARTGAMTDMPGEFWIEDVSPRTYTVIERLDLVGQFQGEVMPSFMPVNQYGTSATASSSKDDPAGDPVDSYQPVQVLKKDVPAYGDSQLAWAAKQDVANEHSPQTITVDFGKAVFATAVTITESWGNGFVDKVEIYNSTDGVWVTVFDEAVNGADPTPDGSIQDFTITLPRMTDFQVNRVRVTIDPMHAWSRGQDEQIDAIELHGLMMTKDQSKVTVLSGQELVWRDGAAMLPMGGGGNGDGSVVPVQPGAVILGPNDDGSTGAIPLGFTFDFYGSSYTEFYINNNGNVTFGASEESYEPTGFPNPGIPPMIAPFWADVDTRGAGSGLVHFTSGTSGSSGNPYVQVDWLDVGYFGEHTDLLNTFTLYIEDRPTGDVVAFFYGDMEWADGDVTGLGGFGGPGAQIGFDSGDGVNYLNAGRPATPAEVAALSNTAQVYVIDPNGAPDGRGTLREEVLVGEQLIFADLVKGSIHAFKFEDIDADGVYEATTDQDPTRPGDQFDRPWAGFVFELYQQNLLTGEFTDLVGTQVSDASGQVWFTGLKPNREYKLVEKGANTNTALGPVVVAQPGDQIMPSTHQEIVVYVGSGEELVWRQGAAMLDSNSPSVKYETLVGLGGETSEVPDGRGLMFGNYVKGSIHGFKFEDYDGDGVYDANEAPFGGITFVLEKLSSPTDQSGTLIEATLTDKDGEFWLEGLVPGYYRLYEDFKGNPLVQTTENPPVFFVGSRQELVWKATRAMLPSDSLRQEFVVGGPLTYGNAVTGSIHGFKCLDIDADGVCETTGHVVFVVDASGSMLGDILEIEAGGDGDADDIPGDYNGDGFSNTKLDAVLVTVNRLVGLMPALPSNANIDISVVVIQGNGAYELDFDPGAGVKKYTSYRNTTQIADALKTVDGTTNSNTNYQAGLNLATSQLVAWNAEAYRSNVYFLSDGYPNTPVGQSGAALADEVAALSTVAGNIIGMGIGEDASLDSLSVIDPLAVIYPTMVDLNTAMLGGNFKTPDVPIAGVTFTLTGTDGKGNSVGPIPVATDANGEFWFMGLYPGSYTVTETLPAGMQSSTHNATNPTWTHFVGSREEYAWAPGKAMLPSGSMKRELVDGKLVFGNYYPGSIHGFKFEDVNANGVYDDGDAAMGNVQFQLWSGGNLINTTSSILFGPNKGTFQFAGLKPGAYTVREVDVAGDDVVPTTSIESSFKILSGQEYVWKKNTPAVVLGPGQYEVLADGDDNPLNDELNGPIGLELLFGNTVLGSIHGFKFEDYNGDGNYDDTRVPSGDILTGDNRADVNGDGFIDFYADRLPDRPGLQIQVDNPWANFPFVVTGDFNGDGVVTSQTVVTDANGEFWLEHLWPGAYNVSEKLDSVGSDVKPTDTTSRDFFVKSRQELVWRPGAAHLPTNTLKVEVPSDLAFSNAYAGSVHGCVFVDVNRNGQQNPGEPTLDNVPVELYKSDAAGNMGALVASTTTSGNPLQHGYYSFNNLPVGWYLIKINATYLANNQATVTTSGNSEPAPAVAPPTHLVFVGSREELVHRDGAAAPLGPNQHEVNVGHVTLVGLAEAQQIPAAISAALLGRDDVGGRQADVDAVDMLLASVEDQATRQRADLSQAATRSTRRAWVSDDWGTSEDGRFKSLVDEVLADLEGEEEDLRAFLA